MGKKLKTYSLVLLACILSLPALLKADDHLQTAKKTVIKNCRRKKRALEHQQPIW